MPAVRHVAIEAGLRLLTFTYREHLAASGTRRSSGRILTTKLGPIDPPQLQRQGAVLRLISTLEAALDALSHELTSKSLAQRDETIELLVLEKQLSGTANWRNRESMFRRHHAIRLNRCDSYKQAKGFVEVRNAIAHGLGGLTTRQRVGQDVPQRLANAGVQLSNQFVVLRDDDVTFCYDSCRRFLQSVDQAA